MRRVSKRSDERIQKIVLIQSATRRNGYLCEFNQSSGSRGLFYGCKKNVSARNFQTAVNTTYFAKEVFMSLKKCTHISGWMRMNFQLICGRIGSARFMNFVSVWEIGFILWVQEKRCCSELSNGCEYIAYDAFCKRSTHVTQNVFTYLRRRVLRQHRGGYE